MTIARVAYVLLSLCSAAKSDQFAASTASCSSSDGIADNCPQGLELLQKSMEVRPLEPGHVNVADASLLQEGRPWTPSTLKELHKNRFKKLIAKLTHKEPSPGSNSSWAFLFERHTLTSQLEYELAVPTTMPVKNKIILALIEGLAFGMCGIDRCYMGQTCLGIIKGVTFGGLGLWALIDYVIVMYNCLAFSPDVRWLGFNATFTDGTVTPAFWMAVAFLTIKLIGKLSYWCSGSKENNDDPKPTCEANDESISKVVVS